MGLGGGALEALESLLLVFVLYSMNKNATNLEVCEFDLVNVVFIEVLHLINSYSFNVEFDSTAEFEASFFHQKSLLSKLNTFQRQLCCSQMKNLNLTKLNRSRKNDFRMHRCKVIF